MSVFIIAIVSEDKKQINDIAVIECQYLFLPVIFLIAKNAAAGAISQIKNIVTAKNGTAVTTDDVIAIGTLWLGKS
ncbi:hypothetical protein KAT51_00965 [bacterium]|nr:hypothetical protein [bacterium]